MSALIPTTPSGRASRVLAALAAGLVLVAATAVAPPVLAQDQSTQQTQQFSPEQLDQLVAPIALYPDNLLGQILTASTYPLEAVMAARWCQANPNVKGPQLEAAMEQQNWDPSIKALTSVPQVLSMMNDKLDWTQQVGDAYLAQPDDLAAAVQRLRLKAQAAGNLQTNAQQRVSYVPAPQPIVIDGAPQPNYVVIEPVDPAVLYVPIYNPVVVYGPWAYPAYPPFFWSPPGFVFGVGVGVIAFGAPFVVGPAIWATYDWRSHHVDIDVMRFNRFNHTSLVANGPGNKMIWEHDPSHRGNIPYNNAVLQQKFNKGINTNASVNPNQKLNLTNPTLGNKGNTGNNNQIKTTNFEKLNTGNNNGNNNQNNKGGNNQIKTTNFEKLNTGNNGGNNNSNNNNNTKLNTTIRTDEHRDLKNNNNNPVIHTQTNNVTNNVIRNNPPPPPPPPHSQGGQGNNRGGYNVEKNKKNP